jgi:hypothetical protein
MATVTTRSQQTKIGAAFRRVGGVGRFMALAQAKRELARKAKQGEAVEIHKETDGGWVVRSTRRQRRGQIIGKIQATTPD